MKDTQHGFSVSELGIVIIAVFLVGFTGYYVWHRHHNSYSVNSVQKSSKSYGSPGPQGWTSYQPSHSTVQFSYPSSWHLASVMPTASDPYTLDNIVITGTNGFTVHFKLVENHVNPAATCAINAYDQPAISINSKYSMVPEYSPITTATGEANYIYLVPVATTTQAGRTCGESWLFNSAAKDNEFQFYGEFNSSPQQPPAAFPVNDFLNKPEVKIAKQIFSTLQV